MYEIVVHLNGERFIHEAETLEADCRARFTTNSTADTLWESA